MKRYPNVEISVDAVNQAFPKYPKTVCDKGWVYGVWYCGTAWKKARLHGEYPATFLKRAIALFPGAKDILHCPSGTVTGPGTTVDLIRDDVRNPDYVASADALPFGDSSYDLWLADPPYSKADAAIYGTPPFSLPKMMKEARRVLRPGAYLGVLHTYYPSYSRKQWHLVGLICVVTGFLRAIRMFSVFRNLKEKSHESDEGRTVA